MLLRALTFLVWAAVAGSALYWGLKLFVTPLQAPAQTAVAQAVPPPAGDLTRLFGAEPVEPPPEAPGVAAPPGMETRFQLIGVVAPRAQGAGGVALIAVDGKLPKAFRVGASVDGETVLQGVQQRGATLGSRGGPVQVALQLPPPPVAATGTLPPPGSEGEAAPRPFAPPGGAAGQGRAPAQLAPGRMPFSAPMGQAAPAQPRQALQPQPVQQMPQMQPLAGQPDHSPGAPGAPGPIETLPPNPFANANPNANPDANAAQDIQRRLGRSGANATHR